MKTDDGTLDLDRTMEAVPALAAAGLTDVRPASSSARATSSAAVDELSGIVAAFHGAAGRTDA